MVTINLGEKEEGRGSELALPAEASGGPYNASPPRSPIHTGISVKKKDLSRQDTDARDTRGRNQGPRQPLTPPGPPLARLSPPQPTRALKAEGGGGFSKSREEVHRPPEEPAP